jgi:hypothetical protein
VAVEQGMEMGPLLLALESEDEEGEGAEPEELECPVCTFELAEGVVRPTGCLHELHQECLEGWRASCARRGWSLTCPMCRSVEMAEVESVR